MATRISPTEVRFSSLAAARTAKLADLLGWTIVWGSQAHRALKARSEDGKEILIPVTTSMNAHRAKSSIRQIMAHSSRDRVNALFGQMEADLTKDDDLAELALELGMIGHKVDSQMQEQREAEVDDLVAGIIGQVVGSLVQEVRVEHGADGQKIKGDWYAVARGDGTTYFECRDHRPPMRVETRAGIGGHNRMLHGDPEEVAATQARAQATQAKQAAERKARRTEVSRKPWLAKKGSVEHKGTDQTSPSGRMFEHPWVDEVTYADGTVEYECNICHEFTNAKGRPVAHHVGAAHKDREHREVETHRVSDYPAPDWHRTNTHRSPKLRTEVLSALDTIENWHLLSREELATQIEERIMEGRPERQPTEPLTDAEILIRIGLLLDRGQFDHLRQEVNALTNMVTDLTTERDEAVIIAETQRGAAERARANLRALRELAVEVDQ